VKVVRMGVEEFSEFLQGVDDPLIQDPETYLRWLDKLGSLPVFWCSGGVGLGYLGLKEGGRLLGALKLLRVRVFFYEGGAWRGVKERGEVREVFLSEWKPENLSLLLTKAADLFSGYGLSVFGVSEWKPEAWSLLERCGLSPYARSVLIGWETGKPIPKEGNPRVSIRPASRSSLGELRRIQRESWGFFIPPNPKYHRVFIAYLDGQAVGSIYLNPLTGNIDYGVHVAAKFQRRRIGAALLRFAQQYFKKHGFKQMYVIRVLRALGKVNEADRTALSFYLNCGGRILREYRGFRVKVRRRRLRIPPLKEFINQLPE